MLSLDAPVHGIATTEDKVVQRAVVEVMNAIYEQDFLGFSYGSRPGRSQHHALDALAAAITTKKVNWVLDTDIRTFFDAMSHGWLVAFIEHRIGCSLPSATCASNESWPRWTFTTP